MSQQPPKQISSQSQNYLQTVINCISERKSTRVPIEDSTINSLYGQASSMIKQLDTGITLCKRYNQAKINRKYEIIIRDLQSEIKRLQDNLKLEQDARSPTKKHVSDILEKLVQFRTENQTLQKDNTQLRQKIKNLQSELSTTTSALSKLQNQQTKGTIERLPPIGTFTSTSLTQGVKEFLKDKQQVRKITKNPISKLQKLINQLKPKMWNWNLCNLLDQIDRWAQGVKDKNGGEVDMWRIRSSIAKKFSDFMDEPQNLIRPSINRGSQDSLWKKSEQKNRIKSEKFSYLGSKRSLNASFQ